MEKIPFWKQKTFWTGIAGAVASGGSLAMGAIEPYTAIMGIIGSLAAIFLRQGVEKSKTEDPK